MDIQAIRSKIARYESAIEQLETELSYIDDLMRIIGFEDGLKTVRASAQELKEKQQDENIGEF